VITKLADGVQLFDFLSLWHQVEDRVEALALESSSESADDHYFAMLRRIFSEFNHLIKHVHVADTNTF